MTRNVLRVLSAALISSVIIPGVTASAAEQMSQMNVMPSSNILIDENISANNSMSSDGKQRTGSQSRHTVDAGMAGLSNALDGYFDAVSRGDVSAEFEVQVGRIASSEVAEKSVVLDYYEHLGIVVVDNYLNVRETPELDGHIIGKMLNNSACDILEVLDGWYRIKSGEVTGYICADYVVTGDKAIALAMSDAKLRAAVNTDALNVRSMPSTDSEIITQITTNERYEVLEMLDGWVKISINGNEYAYVSSEYVEVGYSLIEAIEFEPVSAATEFRNNVVNYALQFLGNPYVWGGESLVNGADCSGFTRGVMANFGIWLPRVSRDQAWAGTRISLDELQPGDLVFYGSGGVVNHVALYIGNGQIVHAISESKGIGITSMWHSTPVAYVNAIGD